mgnify:FL=1
MIIEEDTLYSRVASATAHERAWLYQYLSFDTASTPRQAEAARARAAEAGRQDAWDGRLHLYNRRYDTLPTGFLRVVQRAAAQASVSIEILDKRPQLQPPDLSADTSWLRDYQLAAGMAMLRGQRGVLKAPTGSGKTQVFIALARWLPWARFGVLVHRADLMHQAAERYESITGERAGRLGDSESDIRRFTVATFQTVARGVGKGSEQGALDPWLRGLDAVVIDEVHILPASSFWKTIMRARAARFRWGVSGTPFRRGDQRDVLVVAACGPMLYEIGSNELIARGLLARPEIRMVRVAQPEVGGSWAEVYERGVVQSTQRNAAVVRAVLRAKQPALVFVKAIEHGRLLHKMLSAAGLAVDFVWGSDSTAARKEAVKRLRRGDLQVLVCSTIFDVGIDIPEVRACIVASGGKSAIATIQRLGRGMRVVEGKAAMELWDFLDEGHKWLRRHSRERVRAFQQEGFDVQRISEAAL